MGDYDDETWWRSFHCDKHNRNYRGDEPCDSCEDERTESSFRREFESGNLDNKIEEIGRGISNKIQVIEALKGTGYNAPYVKEDLYGDILKLSIYDPDSTFISEYLANLVDENDPKGWRPYHIASSSGLEKEIKRSRKAKEKVLGDKSK